MAVHSLLIAPNHPVLSGVGMCIIRWVRRGGGVLLPSESQTLGGGRSFQVLPWGLPHTDPNSVTVSKPPRKDRQANVSHSTSPGCFELHAVAAKTVYSGEKSLVVVWYP